MKKTKLVLCIAIILHVVLRDSDIGEILNRDKFMILWTTGQRHI